MRLIDADAFKQYCSEGLEEMKSLFKTDKGLELAIKTTESFLKDIDEQPTVEAQPTDEIKEAYLKGYDYGVKDWFKDKTQPCEDAVSREQVEEITFQEPSYTDPYNILTEVREKVRALKPVQPKRKVNIDGLIATLEIDAENSAGGFGDGIYSAIEVIKDYFGGGEEDEASD